MRTVADLIRALQTMDPERSIPYWAVDDISDWIEDLWTPESRPVELSKISVDFFKSYKGMRVEFQRYSAPSHGADDRGDAERQDEDDSQGDLDPLG